MQEDVFKPYEVVYYENSLKGFIDMRFFILVIVVIISACTPKGSNPVDPFEKFNRNAHKFNQAFDATVLKPPAKLYKAVLPPRVRVGVNNVYNNVNMIPTVANDILQWEWNFAIKDTWRFLVNSSFGILGIFDVAKGIGLPPHINDLGITFAKWGNKQSPYIVIPFLGPSTIRDGMGMMFEYTFLTPYPYISQAWIIYPILALRYVDLRAQMLENEKIIGESFDSYTFIRDAYLQRRNFLITGEATEEKGELYVDADADVDTDFPLTTE